MNISQAKMLLKKYDRILEKEGWGIVEKTNHTEAHIRWMCQEVLEWEDNKTNKAMRWLGFIQGWFFAEKWFTLEELKRHSRNVVNSQKES